MNDHRNLYKEEAYELLAELESSLLELENMPEDEDLIAHVFRSMHTIKGSGSMFGFDNIAVFTHEIESVFDKVRDGKIKVSRKLVKLTLAACDQIKIMVDGDTIDEAEERQLVQGFQKMLHIEESPQESVKPQQLKDDDDISQEITCRIQFHPDPDIFETGTNPLFLLKELQSFGRHKVVAHQGNVPSLKELDPEICYLHWDIFLTTAEDESTIRDIFIFAEEHCMLNINIIDSNELTLEEIAEKKIGHILIERGDITSGDIEKVLQKGDKPIGEMLVKARAINPDTLESALTEQQHIREISKKRLNTISSSIRVPAEKLDSLVDLAGELVTVQARLSRKASLSQDSELTAIAEEVERLSMEMRDNTINVRMLPVGSTFRKFKRLIYDLCNELNKEINVITEGEETELDKTVLEQLNDPLMHIIRNAVDHGIETPESRKAKGKPKQGTIRLAAEHSGSDVLIRISEDGRGLDKKAIKAKAVEKELVSLNEELSESEIYSLIFAPGISTAKRVSGVSGRGVGMDVVKRRIENLRGTVDIESKKDKGTTVTLKLPLTLAIAEGLLVKIGDGNFVLPLLDVEECLELSRQEAKKARKRNIINFREEVISYISLREMFKVKEPPPPPIEKVVVIDMSDRRVGFGVDKVIGQHQTVIKNLGRFYKDVKNISGATILGDGTVALILDVNHLIRKMEKQILQ